MPWVTINLMSGHDEEQKKKLHKDVADAIHSALDVPIERVRIQIVEMDDINHSIGGVSMDEKKA